MPNIKGGVVLIASAWTLACSDSKGAATLPSPLPDPTATSSSSLPRPQVPPNTLTGRVTNAHTAAPIAGAAIFIDGWSRAITDSSGNYTVTGGGHMTYVTAESYVADYRYIGGMTHDIRLYPIERIMAGDSKLVTVAPDDSVCVNNVQDMPGLGGHYVCRSVYVAAPNDGVVTIEAISTQDGAHPPLEVETVGVSPCCSERMGNPTTIHVKAGTVIVAHVEMLSGSTSSQEFLVTTMRAN
jgi:hypothetical protein